MILGQSGMIHISRPSIHYRKHFGDGYTIPNPLIQVTNQFSTTAHKIGIDWAIKYMVLHNRHHHFKLYTNNFYIENWL